MKVSIWKLLFQKQPIEIEGRDDDVALQVELALREVRKAQTSLEETIDALLENHQKLRAGRGKSQPSKHPR